MPLAPDDATPASLLEKWMARARKLARVTMMWLLAVKLLCLAVAPALVYFWVQKRDQVVRSLQSAGRVVRVSQTAGLLTRALVETDLGFYGPRDGVGLGRGEAVILESRATSRPYLCDTEQRRTQLM